MEIQIEAIDPVCGMRVVPGKCESSSFQNRTYHFCSLGCKHKFDNDPATILEESRKRPAGELAGHCCGGGQKKDSAEITRIVAENPDAVFTCPMHPEIEQIGPGDCPLCGMDLEPKRVTADDQHELAAISEMQRRTWGAALLTLPVVLLAMGEMAGLPISRWVSAPINGLVQWGLTTPVLFGFGWILLQRGLSSFRTMNLNMFSLIAVGTIASYCFSVVAILFPAAIPPAFVEDGHVSLYFEAAAVIVTLVLLGQVLELRARNKTGNAIRELLRLTPEFAERVTADGSQERVPIDEVLVGDLLRIRPGEKLPVDGEVIDGTSSIDQSMLTGESIPVEVAPGSKVIGGTMNQNGAFILKAAAVGQDTVLSQIVQMVAEAQRSRAPIQGLADQVAQYFVPAVVVSALLALIGWGIFGPEPQWVHGLVAFVSVLVVACPCALGLATPMSVMVGVGRGASEGILIKDAEAFESLARVDTLVVDKTGTLTLGRPEVEELNLLAGETDRAKILRLASAVERLSEHPLASAIVRFAESSEPAVVKVEEFQSTTGESVSAVVDGQRICIGNSHSTARTKVQQTVQRTELSRLQAEATRYRQQGATVVWMAINDTVVAQFVIKDPVKESATQAVKDVQRLGIEVVMLTGDHHTTASAIAEELGIRQVHAEQTPAGKMDVILQLKNEGKCVAMVGDGVNDALSLTHADVGLAMGTGAGVAMESAGVTLVGGELRGVVKAVLLSRKTIGNIRQNLFFAFFYNALGIPLAAGALYPLLGMMLNPMFAAAAMSLSSVSVIGNALRLRSLRIEP